MSANVTLEIQANFTAHANKSCSSALNTKTDVGSDAYQVSLYWNTAHGSSRNDVSGGGRNRLVLSHEALTQNYGAEM